MNNFFDANIKYDDVSFRYQRAPSIERRDMHQHHELLYYIDGNATFICEKFRKTLTPGSLLLIPREHYHYFQIEEPENFERLRIYFTEIEAAEGFIGELTSEVKIFESLDNIQRTLLDGLCSKMLENSEDEKTRAMAYGSLVVLLSTLSKNESISFHADSYSYPNGSTQIFISHILKHIDTNLTGNISAEIIAKQMNVSLSTLSHLFKKHMGISLHRYVVQKRLILAQRLISEGHNPTKVYIDCGYGDYSSFYKAYLKMFGNPPSHAKK